MRATRMLTTGALTIGLLAAPATAGAQGTATAGGKPVSYLVTFASSAADVPGGIRAQNIDGAVQALDARADVADAVPVARRTAKVTTTLTAAQLAGLPGVTAVELDRPLQLFDDTLQAQQWHLDNDGRSGGVTDADLDAPAAWATSTGAGVVVAVIDTGTQLDHPDLASQLWRNGDEICANAVDDDANGYVDDCVGWDFGQNDADPTTGAGAAAPHGTHVAGIIGAARNGTGVVGVAPDSSLMILKVADSGGTMSLSGAIAAITYAVDNGASIINASWGTSAPSAALRTALEYAGAKGVMVFAAAGNAGTYRTAPAVFPAGYAPTLPNVVSVAATTRTDARASFSNYGQVTLAAPGADIVSTYTGSGWAAMSGTSMASPAAAGVAAIIRAAAPAMTPAQVRHLMAATADRPNGLTGMGSGRVNAAAALAALAPGAPPLPINPPLTPTPVEFLPSITLRAPANVVARGIGTYAEVTFSPLPTELLSRVSGYKVTVGGSSVTLPVTGPFKATFTGLPAGKLPVTVQALLIGPGRATVASTFATTSVASPAVTGTVGAGYGSAAVSWKLVTAYSGSMPVTGYRIRIGDKVAVATGNQTAVVLEDLPTGSPLPVTITVLHGSFEGRVSTIGTVTPLDKTAPGEPTSVKLTTSRGRVTVTWGPPATGIPTGYRVTVGTKTVAAAAGTRTATVSVPAGPVKVSVAALNVYGTSVAATATATVPS